MPTYDNYWYDRLQKACEKAAENPTVKNPTITELARYAQVEQLKRIADALEKTNRKIFPAKNS